MVSETSQYSWLVFLNQRAQALVGLSVTFFNFIFHYIITSDKATHTPHPKVSK